ncbi:MAG: thioredoxin domain-containing protein [Patescibacteria group bacterium]
MSLADRLKYAEMKARHQNLFRPWYKKWWGILIIIISLILIIILLWSGVYVINKVKEIKAEQAKASLVAQKQAYLNAINGDGTNFYSGTLNPQVTVIEFGDFACPICAQAYQAAEAIVEKYPDKVKLVWRDYLIHENSAELALAARCAGEQKNFWQMHDLLFANQADLTETGDPLKVKLLSLAQNLQLNASQFQTCYDDKKYLAQIKKDMDDGDLIKVQGTPSWFVNNYPLLGYIPEEKFQELIQGLIK